MIGADAHRAPEFFAEQNERCEFLLDSLQLGGVGVVGVFLDCEFFGIGVIARIDADLFDPFGGFEGGFGFEMNVGDDGDEAIAAAKIADNILEVRGVLYGRGGDSDDLAADSDKVERLLDAGRGIHRVAGEHRLRDDGMRAADDDAAVRWITDDDLARQAPLKQERGIAVAHFLFRSLGSDGRTRRRSKSQFRLRLLFAAEGEVLDVEKHNIKHEKDDEHGAGGLKDVEETGVDRAAAGGFDEGQSDVTAIEHGQWQKIEQGEVDVHDDAEPDGLLPAVGTFEEDIIDVENLDGAAHVLGFDVGFAREQRAKRADHRFEAAANLFHDSGLGNRHQAPALVPLDADARSAVGGRQRNLWCDGRSENIGLTRGPIDAPDGQLNGLDVGMFFEELADARVVLKFLAVDFQDFIHALEFRIKRRGIGYDLAD